MSTWHDLTYKWMRTIFYIFLFGDSFCRFTLRKTFIYDVAKMTVNSSAPVKVVCKKNLLTPPKKLVGGGGGGQRARI